jgi:hypothetical protein
VPFSVPHTESADSVPHMMMHVCWQPLTVLSAQPLAPTPLHAFVASVSVLLPVALQS